MLAKAETQPSAPGDPDEVCSLDVELVEDRDNVRHAESHLVGLRFVGFIAPTVTSVVDEDDPEIAGHRLEGSGDRSRPNQLNWIEEPTEDANRETLTAVIFEVNASRIARVRREWHRSVLLVRHR